MRKLQRIAEAPRDIPSVVVMAVLADRDFTASLMFLLPAAAAAIGALNAESTGLGWLLLVVDALLFLLGMRLALRALIRSIPTLHRMRTGALALGRITACRHEWQKEKEDMPYEKFLPAWVTYTNDSRVDKASGCLANAIVACVVMPILLTAFGFFLVLLLQATGSGIAARAGGPYVGDLDTWTALALAFAVVVASVVIVIAAKALGSKVLRPGTGKIRPTVDKENAGHDDAENSLAASAGAPMVPEAPLPSYESAAELLVQAEYSVVGARHAGKGRLRFSDRIDLTGVEPLLHSRSHRGPVLFLASLPPNVQIGARGEWEGTFEALAIFNVALMAITAGIALFAWVPKLPAILALLP